MKGYNYPESIEIPPITMHELEQVIHGLPADKAPGDNGIPNRLWQTPPKVTIQEQDEVIKLHNTITDNIQVYTDGSRYNG
jgi:hypothetical protein